MHASYMRIGSTTTWAWGLGLGLLAGASGLGLGWLAGRVLSLGPVAAWTEAELQGAKGVLQAQVEQRHAAAAKAKAEVIAKAKAKAELEARAKAQAEAKAKAEREAGAAAALQQARDSIANRMVSIRAGEFQMGCDPKDTQCDGDERPAHRVRVPAFRMGRYEVTQAQWQAVMNDQPNPARFKGGERPVEGVSWNDAQAFLKRLNADGKDKPYRLPTEAEWEYAARAGSKTPYWWGTEIGKGNANCDGCGSQWDNQETAPVGSFKPNAFGLYDTAGNVWEWVQDCYHGGYPGAPADGAEWRDNCVSAGRVLRGGSWLYDARNARASSRFKSAPDYRVVNVGLRLAQGL